MHFAYFEERNDGARARKIGRWLGQLSTLSCRVSYVPRLAKVVNVLAKRKLNKELKLLGSV